MESQEKFGNRSGGQNVDWERFGLGSRDGINGPKTESGTSRRRVSGEFGNDYGTGGHQPSGDNELFAEEQGDGPWWKANFFVSQPVLFGTWDGVFTSCLINIFGVIIFLRSGWMVAEAGVINAVLIILCTVTVVLISVLSAIGICERCRMESGGVYFLISHVLGDKIAGAIGLLYVFGQAVGCALYVLGFGESMAGLVGLDSRWAERGFASAAVLLLGAINLAGVKWVVKLQFLLLLILLLAGLDFVVGSFIHTDHENGFEGWMSGQLTLNLASNYSSGQDWFTVLGVFFPTVTGIMAGINMSGDLRNPSRDIPAGTLAALGTGTSLYLAFALVLGATCQRDSLRVDSMLAAKVSAVRVLLLAGLYVSSMSSCLAAMYGTPRVLQSIAAARVVPVLRPLEAGRGPNRVPVRAMVVVAAVTVTFILVGEINTLAPVVTMPFLLTYAAIDYAYFALAQTFDLQHRRDQRFVGGSTGSGSGSGGYQALDEGGDGPDDDLDQLFPERTRHKTAASVAPTPAADHVHSKPQRWYTWLCNRWLSLAGVLLKLIMMGLVHWGYALGYIAALTLIALYVQHANPAVAPGRAADFKLAAWLRESAAALVGRRKRYGAEQVVVTPAPPGLQLAAAQLNEDNEDFASRRRYHQSSTVHGHFVDNTDSDV